MEAAKKELETCVEVMSSNDFTPDQFFNLTISDCMRLRDQLSLFISKVNELGLNKENQELNKPADFAYDIMKMIGIDADSVIQVFQKLENIIDLLGSSIFD